MALISFLLKGYREKCINFIHNINFIGYTIIIAVTVVDFFLILSAPNFYNNDVNEAGRIFIIIAALLLIIITIVMLFLYFSLRHSFQKLRQMNAINQRSLALEKEQYLSLQQKNNDLRKFRHDFHNHILSLKELVRKEKKNHGFGLTNIHDVVNKYHGAMDLKYADGFFSVYISIQNLQSKKKGN